MPKLSKMEEKAYRAAPGLNKSLLTAFMRSPAHYVHEVNNPKEPTASMDIGTAVHAELLQPLRASEIYAVCRKVDRRKTADKEYLAEFEAQHAGKVIIDEEQKKVVDGMRDAAMRHPEAYRLISSATHTEQALFAKYKSQTHDHEFEIKALADGLDVNGAFLFDIKSTENASPSEFAKKVRAFRYDIQQVHYTFCAMLNGILPAAFPFIVIENTAPFGVAVYSLEAERIKRTWDEWKLAMDYYAHCHMKQDFSAAYPEVITELKF